MAFADQFANVANDYFGDVAAHPACVTAWCGVFAFGMQIYFDFSGLYRYGHRHGEAASVSTSR